MVKLLILLELIFLLWSFSQEISHPWLNQLINDDAGTVANIKTPDHYQREEAETNNFALWLRCLPLKPTNSRVKLYDGTEKYNQRAHFRILDIDVGNKDLQQCADAAIRLRAEYFFSIKKYDDIHFNFTSGDNARYIDWAAGYRPMVNNNRVQWIKKASPDSSYQNFRKYLNTVFMYAGSYSLKKEMKKINRLSDIKIGDVFIQGGFPGHAVIVVDLAKSEKNSDIAVLLAQSYMPAQDVHILINPGDAGLSPWYIIGRGAELITPEWTFRWDDLSRF